MPVFKRLHTTRIVAAAAALDAAVWPHETIQLRIAGDELLLIPAVTEAAVSDPHAIIVADTAWAGLWLPADEALAFLAHACEWELPSARPAFAQGAVAGVATKLWLTEEKVLLIVPAPYAAEMEERMA